MGNKVLIHHGIEGQKWGKQNGPPYPLDYEEHSAAEKKNNPKSDLNNYENGHPKEDNRTFFQKHKKAIIVGGTVAAVAAVAIGSKYIKQKREQQSLAELVSQSKKNEGNADPEKFIDKIFHKNEPITKALPDFEKAKETVSSSSKTDKKDKPTGKDVLKTVFSEWGNPFKNKEAQKEAKEKIYEWVETEIIEPDNRSRTSMGQQFIQQIISAPQLLLEDKQMRN